MDCHAHVIVKALFILLLFFCFNFQPTIAYERQKSPPLPQHLFHFGNNQQKHWNCNNEISRRQLIEKIKATTAAISSATSVISGKQSASAMSIEAETKNKESATILSSTVPMVRLGNGSLNVSRTIQGYWQLAGGHGKYRENDAIQNMIEHYKLGINTLDTADIYGPSEIIIGKFIGQTMNSNLMQQSNNDAIVPMTKFCCFRYLEEIDRNEVRQRILKSCERLQVKQLPLVQFFWSRYDVKRYIDVALYLTELKEEGLIGEIGATNFDLKRLQELKKAGVPIVSHQVQLSALDRRPVQSGMANWCAENNVSLIGFGTVGSGTCYVIYSFVFFTLEVLPASSL
jgi:diketogulonate reductase-like aldo/keto reductase